MTDLLSWLRPTASSACACELEFDGDALVVAADDCPGGDLATAADCRVRIVRALRRRDVDRVVVRDRGTERRYEGRSAALLVAAGRFAELVGVHDDRLARRAERDPIAAAAEATGRSGPVSEVGATSGLIETAADLDALGGLSPYVGPTIARSRVHPVPPANGRLEDSRTTATNATVRIYAVPGRELRTYVLEPVEVGLDAAAHETLANARRRLAASDGGERAAHRAVRAVADGTGRSVERLAAVLRKHTVGYGILEDLFADDRVGDVFATAPVSGDCLRVRADGELLRTNVLLTEDGAAALASRLRRESGRGFSRAAPTIDAVADLAATDGQSVRAAGVTDPVSDGYGFAFRSHADRAWTVPALVDNGTLPARVAALLSLGTERAAATLVAGARGAGKTTLLGALLWELPAATRLVVIEDTPELPVDALRTHGRDAQSVRTSSGEGRGLAPDAALRTALRLGEGALVVGEVRGEEAAVLYEAMRVGAGGSAVLGTIHGEGGGAVRERVVSDLGVPASSFGATDLVVTLGTRETADGRDRGVTSVEEVVPGDAGPEFAPLFDRRDADGELRSTDRLERGNSRFLAGLASPGERYDELLAHLARRSSFLRGLVDRGSLDPEAVVSAHGRRRTASGDASDLAATERQ